MTGQEKVFKIEGIDCADCALIVLIVLIIKSFSYHGQPGDLCVKHLILSSTPREKQGLHSDHWHLIVHVEPSLFQGDA